MQSEKDAARIRALGAPRSRSRQRQPEVRPGNSRPTPFANWLEAEARAAVGRAPIIVAGSIVASEEPLALIAFGTLQGEHPRALLVLAPRKPERFEEAGRIHRRISSQVYTARLRACQFPAPSKAVSQNGEAIIRDDVTVLLLDSIGELGSLYRVADGAFVGGSLVPSGGHNILEPAAFGKNPNFRSFDGEFRRNCRALCCCRAAIQVESPEDAGVAWIELLRNPERMRRMGDAARGLIEGSRGAADRALVESRNTCRLWVPGDRWIFRRQSDSCSGRLRSSTEPMPGFEPGFTRAAGSSRSDLKDVISIGNLTVGGPVKRDGYLAHQKITRSRETCAILSRGYRSANGTSG